MIEPNSVGLTCSCTEVLRRRRRGVTGSTSFIVVTSFVLYGLDSVRTNGPSGKQTPSTILLGFKWIPHFRYSTSLCLLLLSVSFAYGSLLFLLPHRFFLHSYNGLPQFPLQRDQPITILVMVIAVIIDISKTSLYTTKLSHPQTLVNSGRYSQTAGSISPSFPDCCRLSHLTGACSSISTIPSPNVTDPNPPQMSQGSYMMRVGTGVGWPVGRGVGLAVGIRDGKDEGE